MWFVSLLFVLHQLPSLDEQPSDLRVTRSHLNVLETKKKRRKPRINNKAQLNLRPVHSNKDGVDCDETGEHREDELSQMISKVNVRRDRFRIDQELNELEAKMDAQFASLLRVYDSLCETK